jgi:hypothetical protein
VLRCLAWRLGMCKVASEKKRAVRIIPTHEERTKLMICRFNSAPAQQR